MYVSAYDGIDSYDDLRKHYTEGALNQLLLPISAAVSPGDHVVVKPNFVKESHLQNSDQWEQIITNGELIRIVGLEVIKALQGKGKLTITDAPQTDSDWEEIIKRVELPSIVEELQSKTSATIEYFDMREERWVFKEGITVRRKKLSGDPLGYSEIDLGTDSLFADKVNKNYYGADYDDSVTKHYHNEDHNIYVISNTVLDADVFINLPKWKTHKLAGMTCCLKNLVGACVIKNSIPHHTLGIPKDNADQFANDSNEAQTEGKLKHLAAKFLKYKNPLINYPFIIVKKIVGKRFGGFDTETVRNGSWYGNDTIWRATLDLNRILLYADKKGVMHDEMQRKYLAFVDGIVAGEGNGPISADAKYTGVVFSGKNPVAIDAAAAKLMGFDYRKIPTISHGFEKMRWPLILDSYDDIYVSSENAEWNYALKNINVDNTFKFKPHFGWCGYIEL